MADGEGIRLLGADVLSALEKLDAQSRLRGAPDLCWVVRGVPIDVRAMADAAADERNLTLGDWLTNAIIDRARFEAAQTLKARTVQDPLADATWDETPRTAAGIDLAAPGRLAPQAPSDVISDMDTDTLEALALEALLPETLLSETLASDAQAIEAFAVDALTPQVSVSEAMGPELYGPPTPILLADPAELEASALTEVAPPDELAAILDSVRAIVAFAKLDGDTVYGPDIMQVPAQPQMALAEPALVAANLSETVSADLPRGLWEDLSVEAEADADHGTVLWFVEPETLIAGPLEPETIAPMIVTFDALVQDEAVHLPASEDAGVLSEPVILSLIEPEAVTEAAMEDDAHAGETWLPKVEVKSKKSLMGRIFRR